MNFKYKKELDQYTVPAHLLRQTKQKMEDAMGKEKSVVDLTVGRAKRRPYRLLYAAAAAVLVICSALIFSRPQQIGITTPLYDGEHTTTVELSDGVLQFYQDNETLLSMPDPLGEYSAAEEAKATEKKELFSDHFLFPKPDKTFTEKSARFFTAPDATGAEKGISYQYHFVLPDSDASIRVFATSDEANTSNAPNSVLKDIPLYLSWQQQSGTYTAEFYYRDIFYRITAAHVQQKAFIDFLLEFLI